MAIESRNVQMNKKPCVFIYQCTNKIVEISVLGTLLLQINLEVEVRTWTFTLKKVAIN